MWAAGVERNWEGGARLWRSISLGESCYACSQRLDVSEQSGVRFCGAHRCEFAAGSGRIGVGEPVLVRSFKRSRGAAVEEVDYWRSCKNLTELTGCEAWWSLLSSKT